MRIKGRPRHVAGVYFIHVGQGVFAPASTRTFHAGGCGVGLLFGPAVQRLAGIGHAVQFGRRRRRDLVRVLQAAGGEGLDQLRFPGGVAVHGIHVGQMPRAAKRQRRAGQRDDESAARNRGVPARATSGLTGGCGTR